MLFSQSQIVEICFAVIRRDAVDVAESGADDDGDSRASWVALQTARSFHGTQLQDQFQLCHRRTPAQRCVLLAGFRSNPSR